jgi:hypothetical protein
MYWEWGDNSRRKSEGQGMGVLLTLEGSGSGTLGEGSFDNLDPTTTSLIHALSQLLLSRHLPGYGVRSSP